MIMRCAWDMFIERNSKKMNHWREKKTKKTNSVMFLKIQHIHSFDDNGNRNRNSSSHSSNAQWSSRQVELARFPFLSRRNDVFLCAKCVCHRYFIWNIKWTFSEFYRMKLGVWVCVRVCLSVCVSESECALEKEKTKINREKKNTMKNEVSLLVWLIHQ